MTSNIQPPAPGPAQYAGPAPRRRRGLVLAIAVVVIIVVIAVISFAFLRSEATMHIRVYSTHLLTSISYILSIDDELIDSGTLDVGDFLNLTYSYSWWFSDNATIEVSATSTGGLFGSVTDTETIAIEDEGSYTVNLFV